LTRVDFPAPAGPATSTNSDLPVVATRSLRPAVYAMGILAAYWCFERMAVWLA